MKPKPTVHELEEFLSCNSVTFERLDQVHQDQLMQQWLEVFASGVKRETGHWIHRRFRWHGYTYGYECAISGSEALEKYNGQWSAPFFIFDEDESWSYACTSGAYPDFSGYFADIYVAHKNMKWTMAFTHETPHIGPFFAERSA